MYCTECGTKNPEDSKFCKHCGLKLERVAERVSEEAYTRALPVTEQVRELLERAYSLRYGGDTTAAIAACEQALQLSPDSTSAHSLLGQLCVLQGDRDRAIREYERVLQLNPGSIADRVKLDELRDADRPKARTNAVASSKGHTTAPVSVWNMVSLAAAGAALLITGGLVALQMRSHSAPRTLAGSPPTTPSGLTSPASLASNDTAANGGTPLPEKASRSGKETASSAGDTTNETPTDMTSPFRNMGQPLLTAKNPLSPSLPAITPQPASPSPTNARPTKPKTATAKGAKEEGKDDRIVLGDSSDEKGSEGHYTIRITAGGTTSKETAPRPKNEVRISSGNGENLPGADARTAIGMADDLKQKGDFDKAIKAYQKALPTAGDQTGHVYHQMAFCFQNKGDRSSAKVNYERAISEYQKLIDAGKNVESTQTSIRVCRTGLKICE